MLPFRKGPSGASVQHLVLCHILRDGDRNSEGDFQYGEQFKAGVRYLESSVITVRSVSTENVYHESRF